MLKSKCFSKKSYVVIGMGKTGCSIYKSLINSGAVVYFWEDNPKHSKKILNKGYKKYSSKISQIDYVIPSPGIATKGKSAHKLIKKLTSKNTKLISELDLFQIYLDNLNIRNQIKIIAVTGTNGKSTTVSLIHHILKKNKFNTVLAGNIGNPIFETKMIKKGFYVLELSSYQLESSKIFQPDIACILNLTPDHLARHNTMSNYGNAKLNIFKNINSSQKGFFNNDSIIKKLIKKNNHLNKMKNLKQINKNKKNSIKKLNVNQYNLLSNDQNYRFSYEILKEVGLSSNKIFNAFKSFRGLEFRQQIIFSDKRKLIINDSKSTNYHSLIAALKKYKDIILICGGQIKSNNISILDDSLGNIKKVIIIGEESNTFHKYFQSKVTTVYVHSLDKAVVEMSKFMKTNTDFNTFLFSPGAASFDQYNNFEERGRHFNKLISKLSK